MKIFAMSDIHDCLQEFEAALELVDLSGDNKLILLGDYIHSGADSYGVLKKNKATAKIWKWQSYSLNGESTDRDFLEKYPAEIGLFSGKKFYQISEAGKYEIEKFEE